MKKVFKVLEKLNNYFPILEGKDLKVGDIVQYFGGKKDFEVVNIVDKNYVNLHQVGRPRDRFFGNAVNRLDLHVKGDSSKPVDINGRSAEKAAKTLGELVVLDLSRTTSESVGRVKKISPKGMIIVDQFIGVRADPRNANDQETFKAQIEGSPSQTLKMTAKLHNGKWGWWSESTYIKKSFKGGKLTRLLQ